MNRMWRLILSVISGLGLLLAPQIVNAETKPANPSISPDTALRFERLSVEDGLPHATVLSALQDQKGFMWFATADGLSRYDGYTFTTFRHDADDLNSLSNNNTFSLIESQDGLLWIGTDPGGLNVYDPATGKFSVYRHNPDDPTSLIDDSVWALLEDHDGRIWAGTRNGLSRLDRATGKFTNYPYSPDIPRALAGAIVYRLFQDSSGVLWVATRGGLHRYDPQTDDFTIYQNDPNNPKSLSSNLVWALEEDSHGNFWVGTRRGGLNLFDREKGTFTAFRANPNDPTSLSDDNIWSIFEDSKGNLWVTTENGGINLFDPESQTFKHYQYNPGDPYSISNNDIYWVTEDRSGVVWFTSRYGGVNKLSPALQRFGLYRNIPGDPNSLTSNNVYSVLAGKNNILWIGTFGGGLNRIDRNTGQLTAYRFNPKDPLSISNDKVYYIYSDEQDVLWVATSGGGLNRMDPLTGNFSAYRYSDATPDVISSNYLTTIEPAGNQRLWVGTLGYGLDLFDTTTGKTIKNYAHDETNPDSLAEDTVYDLAIDSQGNIWVATARGGVDMLNPQTGIFTHHRQDPENANSLLSDTVQTVFFDPTQNMLWAGTAEGLSGLDLQNGQWHNYTVAHGLPNNTIVGIQSDRRGNLWISTGKGISQFNPEEKTFTNYNARDGLQGDQFTIASSSVDVDGILYFGGSAGLTYFDPEQITKNAFQPPVVFTDFMLFNQPVTLGSELIPQPIEQLQALTLNYDQSVFTIKYAALNYQASPKNLYQHKLVGFDKDWSPPLTKNEVTYTNLSPGSYVLMVRASNNDGVFNETPVELKIVINPPWWGTLWFRALLVLVIIGLIVGIFNLRVRNIHKINRELEKRVNERTHALQETDRLLKSTNGELLVKLDEITALQKKVEEQAIRDALTGLFNRHYLSEMLETELSRANRSQYPVAFILIDLDHFKNVNDQHGHQAGDTALKNAAQVILSQTRRSDIACRYGGEEFLVVMPNITPKDAENRAEQIRAGVEKLATTFKSAEIHLTVSVGVAIFPQDGETADELLYQVDRALYQAKQSGRNKVIVFGQFPLAGFNTALQS